jgi:hypothetical protein
MQALRDLNKDKQDKLIYPSQPYQAIAQTPQPMPIQPSHYDVLFGPSTNFMPNLFGNNRFLELIGQHARSYLGSPQDCIKVASSIVSQIQAAGGRFLEEQIGGGHSQWHIIPTERAIQISLQMLQQKTFADITAAQNQKPVLLAPSGRPYQPHPQSAIIVPPRQNIIQHNHNDVLFGQSVNTMPNLLGNEYFRRLIEQNGQIYRNSSPQDRINVASSIVSEIIASGGRFLEEHMSSNDGQSHWNIITTERAIQITLQTLQQQTSAHIFAAAAPPPESVRKRIIPTEYDVIFDNNGRARNRLGHSSSAFDQLIDQFKGRFSNLDRLAEHIMACVHQKYGKFLKYFFHLDRFEELDQMETIRLIKLALGARTREENNRSGTIPKENEVIEILDDDDDDPSDGKTVIPSIPGPSLKDLSAKLRNALLILSLHTDDKCKRAMETIQNKYGSDHVEGVISAYQSNQSATIKFLQSIMAPTGLLASVDLNMFLPTTKEDKKKQPQSDQHLPGSQSFLTKLDATMALSNAQHKRHFGVAASSVEQFSNLSKKRFTEHQQDLAVLASGSHVTTKEREDFAGALEAIQRNVLGFKKTYKQESLERHTKSVSQALVNASLKIAAVFNETKERGLQPREGPPPSKRMKLE